VLDFVCLERKLVVEVDGGQHNESSRDRDRDRILTEAGFGVLRYWNHDVLAKTDDVVRAIHSFLNPSPPVRSRALASARRFAGAKLRFAKPRLRPLEGEGETSARCAMTDVPIPTPTLPLKGREKGRSTP
jgi:hypothetical protein